MDDGTDSTEFDLDHAGRVVLTLLAEVAGEGRHMRRTALGGEYGHLKLSLSPFHGDHEYRFEWNLRERTLPEFARTATLTGVKMALREELPGDRRVSGVRVAVVGGIYHDTDSSVRTFELAAGLAMRDALSRAKLTKG